MPQQTVLFSTRRLLPAITTGVIIGLMEIFLTLAFAALVFTGPLAGYLYSGIGFALLGAAVSGTLVALFTSLPGIVSGNQDVPAAITAVMVGGVIASLPAGAGEQTTFITALAAVAITSILTGVCFFLLGALSLGNLVRFLPYPVLGGFLAGASWLLLTGAIELALDAPLQWAQLLQADALLHWLPALLLALLLLVVLERTDHHLALPAILLLSTVLFFVVAALLGLSTADLSSGGWLLGPFPAESLWRLPAWGEIGRVQWASILVQLPNMATVVLLSTVAMLLNVSGLELTAQQDVSLNHELRVAGMGNVLGGFAGSIVSYQQFSLSALGLKTGGSRLAGLIGAGVCLVALTIGASFLSSFPRIIIGGLLGYVGLSIMKEWVVDARHRLPRVEYAIVIFILAVVIGVGLLEAVTVGVVAAIILFVVAYSRTDVVRQVLTGATVSSRVTRSDGQQQVLRALGHHILILRLQGFIFFGTADKLLHQIEMRLMEEKEPAVRFLLLDFRRVTGLDSTAVLSLRKLKQVADQHAVTLLVTEPTPTLRQQLMRGKLSEADGVKYFPDMDQGIAWCEDQLLARRSVAVTPPSLQEQLARLLPDDEDLRALIGHLQRQEVRAGTILMAQGDPPDHLYFIESGQVTAQTAVAGRPPRRLETMGAGRVVGELGFYLGQARTASVVVDKPGVVYLLTRAKLAQMEQSHPQAAAALHRLMVNLLADRVTHLVNTVNALEQ